MLLLSLTLFNNFLFAGVSQKCQQLFHFRGKVNPGDPLHVDGFESLEGCRPFAADSRILEMTPFFGHPQQHYLLEAWLRAAYAELSEIMF